MLTAYDIALAPICLLILRLLYAVILRSQKDVFNKKIMKKAFAFKMISVIAFTLVTALYYGEGDTEMYFFATRDMKAAISANDLSFGELFRMTEMEEGTPLAYYFESDGTKYPVSGFMRSSSNFLVPKIAVIPSFLFLDSFFCLCMVFSFFALCGMTRLYSVFIHYFPTMKSEIALAALFIPSACYWSSGLLKDSLCFGAIGFLLYGLFSVFVLRKRFLGSIFWIAVSVYLLYTIKVYIFLALLPGIGFWLFGMLSSRFKQVAIKRAILAVSLVLAAFIGYYMIDYLTSSEAMAKFSLDNLLETSSSSRETYEGRTQGSYFAINTTNPVLLGLNGLVATFFRPFPWEISSAIVALSAAESFLFLSLIVYVIYKRGIGKFLSKIFYSPILILSFSFAIIFAMSVGISATNFGSLSRYKIPCLPFYLIFVLASYRLLGQSYPKWFRRILSLVQMPNRK